jgi:hypothetical protein
MIFFRHILISIFLTLILTLKVDSQSNIIKKISHPISLIHSTKHTIEDLIHLPSSAAAGPHTATHGGAAGGSLVGNTRSHSRAWTHY